MSQRAMICVGDTTTHGGRVLEGDASASVEGKPIAGVGHKVMCPKCKGGARSCPMLNAIRNWFEQRRVYEAAMIAA